MSADVEQIPTRNSAEIDATLAGLGSLIMCCAALSAITGLADANPLVPTVLAVVAAVAGAAQAGLTNYVQRRTTPSADVVEAVTADGVTVLAGPANDRVDVGEVVRVIPERAAADPVAGG